MRWVRATHRILLTQDPIGRAGGVNLYAYAGSNPIAFSDPFGLVQEDCCKVVDWSQLGEHVVPRHVEGTQGPASLFADTEEKGLRHLISATTEKGQVVAKQIINGEVRYVVERNWKSAVGTKGEQIVRVVVSEAGRLVTAFPVSSTMAKGIGAAVAGASSKLGKFLGPIGTAVGIIMELGPSATPLKDEREE